MHRVKKAKRNQPITICILQTRSLKKILEGGEICHLNIANYVKPVCPPTTAYVCGG